MIKLRNRLPRLVLVLLLCSCAASASATGLERLNRFFKDLSTMRAQFVQTLLDPSNKVLEESEGVLLVSRPGRFRLDYQTPYQQLYVADGKRVWMYDKDLEQVTVRAQQAALGSTPALVLSGTEPLEKAFTITELGFHEGFQWLELKPKRPDSNFETVRLAMEDDLIRAMEMTDGFGQSTRLYFRKVERNPKLPEDSFRFTPPPGVDVIGEDG